MITWTSILSSWALTLTDLEYSNISSPLEGRGLGRGMKLLYESIKFRLSRVLFRC